MNRAIRQVAIRGRVQGVGYRAWVEHEAMARHLEGWVRNRRDGSVEAVISGPNAAVSALIYQAGQGPVGAHVGAVEVEEWPLQREEFSLAPTI